MQVTTADSGTLNFDPFRVFMLTGPLPTDGSTAVFYLHGVGPAPIPQLPGTMAAFIPTMPNGSNFVELHFAKDGAAFYANAKHIHTLSSIPTGQPHPNANAMISLGGKNRLITETVSAAKTAIDGAGGTI